MAGAGAKKFPAFSKLTSDDVNNYLADQVIMRFATTSARDAAFGGVGEPTLAEGMTAYIDADNSIYTYDGSNWATTSRVGGLQIIQVQTSSDTTSRSTTSDYPVVSTLNVSITPRFASSKIFLVASISIATTGGSNTNKIALAGLSYGSGSTTSIYRTRLSAAAISTDFFMNANMSLLHEPATTSPCIYNVLYGRYSASFDNTVVINGDVGGGVTARSTITAFEISI